MAYQNERAGKSTREMAKKRRNIALWILIAGVFAIFLIGILLQYSEALGIGGIGILGLLVLLKIIPAWVDGRSKRKFKEVKRAVRGAKAEEKIGSLLHELSEDYYVLNDIVSSYGNIDHIVISKTGGMFLIETKAHGGRVELDGDTLLVNGKLPEKDFIVQTLRNSYWLRDEVGQMVGSKPWVTPVLVFTNAFVSISKPVKGIRVINKKYLLNILQRTNNPNQVNAKLWEQRANIESRLITGE